MDFDHLPKNTKIKAVSILLGRSHSKEEIKTEIAKCELVCSNCHRIRTIIRILGLDDFNKWIPKNH